MSKSWTWRPGHCCPCAKYVLCPLDSGLPKLLVAPPDYLSLGSLWAVSKDIIRKGQLPGQEGVRAKACLSVSLGPSWEGELEGGQVFFPSGA